MPASLYPYPGFCHYTSGLITAVENPAEETMAEWNEIITAAENPAEETMAEWNEIIIAVKNPAKEPARGWVELGSLS